MLVNVGKNALNLFETPLSRHSLVPALNFDRDFSAATFPRDRQTAKSVCIAKMWVTRGKNGLEGNERGTIHFSKKERLPLPLFSLIQRNETNSHATAGRRIVEKARTLAFDFSSKCFSGKGKQGTRYCVKSGEKNRVKDATLDDIEQRRKNDDG